MIEARKDEILTAAKGFLDKRSYVTLGDKVWLYGEDMNALRQNCFVRSRGRCEMISNAAWGRCSAMIEWDSFEMHHNPPVSKGGYDHLEGVLASCKRCHVNSHNREVKWSRP